ncbi:hypothetical protein C8R42DRAFT_637961 [Lentinula raphanica]|nr:hypothetical protein C8R42DRAFT_637961 [Lentinula raphanica]
MHRTVKDHATVIGFLDLKAADGEASEESESELGHQGLASNFICTTLDLKQSFQDGFIDDDAMTAAPSIQPQPISGTPRVNVSTTSFLQHLEDTYVNQVAAHASIGEGFQTVDDHDDEPTMNDLDDILALNDRDRDWLEQAFPEIEHQADDWALFGVKCKTGSEYGLLYDLMHNPVLESELRCAFVNSSLGNYLYLEAKLPQFSSHLLEFLSNRSDVQLNTLKLIPSENHKSCLWVRPRNKFIFSEGTWVQIKSGIYKGDVGLVRGLRVTPARACICVLLVPRLHRFRNYHQTYYNSRPPMDLVLDTLEAAGIEKHILENDAPYFLWDNNTFQSGLLVDYFPPAFLSVANSISSANRELLFKSGHPRILERQYSLPIPDSWLFQEGEMVHILDDGSDAISTSTNGVIRAVLPNSCEVEIELDIHTKEVTVLPMARLVKKFVPGDYVKVVAGPFADTTGLVGEKSGRVLGLILDNAHTVASWVDVNLVVLTTSITSLAVQNTPLKDIEVLVMRSDIHSRTQGRIKRAWSNGHGSVRLVVYLSLSDCSIELDYTQVVLARTMEPLHQLVLDTQTFFDYFNINRNLHMIKTGPEPWIGVRVLVVQGNYHGITGTVREVNKYPVDAGKNLRASGISLTVELDLATTNVFLFFLVLHPIDHHHSFLTPQDCGNDLNDHKNRWRDNIGDEERL